MNTIHLLDNLLDNITTKTAITNTEHNIESKKIIFLWSTRRTLSSALQRAVFQLDHIKHFCEPFCVCFYFGPNRKSIQFKDKQHITLKFEKIPTISEPLLQITKDYSLYGFNKTFVKEHAIYVYPNTIPKHILISSIHTFIIRHPNKAIKSLYRQSIYNHDPNAYFCYDKFVASEVGFKEQWLMYDLITNKLNQKAIIIDADDLMAYPKQILIKYCQFTGLKYNDNMLDWSNDSNKPNKPWDVLPDSWGIDIKQTNGFRKKDKEYKNIKYPQIVIDSIEESIQFYKKLYDKRVRV